MFQTCSKLRSKLVNFKLALCVVEIQFKGLRSSHLKSLFNEFLVEMVENIALPQPFLLIFLENTMSWFFSDPKFLVFLYLMLIFSVTWAFEGHKQFIEQNTVRTETKIHIDLLRSESGFFPRSSELSDFEFTPTYGRGMVNRLLLSWTEKGLSLLIYNEKECMIL